MTLKYEWTINLLRSELFPIGTTVLTILVLSYWTFWFTISSNSYLLCHSKWVGLPDLFTHNYQHFLNFQGFPGLQENKSSLLGKVLLTFQIIALVISKCMIHCCVHLPGSSHTHSQVDFYYFLYIIISLAYPVWNSASYIFSSLNTSRHSLTTVSSQSSS